MNRKVESAWRRYGLMIAAVAIAVGAKVALDPFIEEQEPFLLFLGVVAISAWYGGLVPGLIATVLTSLAADYFFIPPDRQLNFSHFVTDIRLDLFVLEGVVISWLTAMVHTAIEQRQESQQRYQRIVETAEEGIWVFDQQWRTRLVNTALADMLGYDLDEMTGRELFDFMDPDDRALVRDALAGEGDQTHSRHEFKFRRCDEATIWTVFSTSPIVDDNSTGRLAMVTDITARKQAEQELARHREHLEDLVQQRTRELEESFQRLRISERMAGLGTLAAGLGHDMGNLLMPLNMRIERLEGRQMSPETNDDVQAIRGCAEYLQSLTNGLRLFSSNPDDVRTWGDTTDLHEWWPDVFRFFRNTLPRGVTLENRFEEGLPSPRVPRHMLTQAVFNLVHNAGQAMEGRRGTVTVWAGSGHDEHTIQLGVTDDGPGMDERTRRRCLEPFFSTKDRPESQGLGLALVHLIVQKVRGSVEIESALGEGTTFTLILPAATPASVVQKA